MRIYHDGTQKQPPKGKDSIVIRTNGTQCSTETGEDSIVRLSPEGNEDWDYYPITYYLKRTAGPAVISSDGRLIYVDGYKISKTIFQNGEIADHESQPPT